MVGGAKSEYDQNILYEVLKELIQLLRRFPMGKHEVQ